MPKGGPCEGGTQKGEPHEGGMQKQRWAEEGGHMKVGRKRVGREKCNDHGNNKNDDGWDSGSGGPHEVMFRWS